jgi:hypothetical protein
MPHDLMSEGLKCLYAGASDIHMTGRQITAKCPTVLSKIDSGNRIEMEPLNQVLLMPRTGR